MLKHIVVLSGRSASGKSTLAKKLISFYSGYHFETCEIIKNVDVTKYAKRRSKNQVLSDALDRKTDGKWLSIELSNALSMQTREVSLVVLDSVKLDKQIRWLRKAYGNKVIHIHLVASFDELVRRHKKRKKSVQGDTIYENLWKSKSEKGTEKLADIADVVIDTDLTNEDDVFVRARAQLKLDAHTVIPLVDVIVGGQYGSEGKGNIAAHIAPEYKYLVRVGGPNAGHKVYGEPVRSFRHLPSGTEQAPEAKVILGPGIVINPEVLFKEISEIGGISHQRLSIDPNAMIIEQRDIDAEASLKKNIASTAQGVGFATARKITDRGVAENPVKTARDIPSLKPFVRETGPILQRAYANLEPILLEGTQGTALSLHHGLYPYVTSRDTTVAGCLAEAGISPRRVRKVILVCRTYPIRVGGKSGPMGKEVSYEELASRSGIDIEDLKSTEKTTTTNRQRRIAEFDWAQLHNAVVLNAPTDIALTFVDYLDVKNRDARRFEQLQVDTIKFIEEIEKLTKAPVSLISTRFKYRSVIDRRSW